MTYLKGALVSGAIRIFPFYEREEFCVLRWHSTVPAKHSVSNFSSNQKNNFFYIWLPNIVLSGSAHL